MPSCCARPWHTRISSVSTQPRRGACLGCCERAVKWQEDRSEGFVSDNQGRDHSTRAELALDENGRFLGLRVSILANLGAYLSPFGCFIPTRSTDLISGLYSIGAIHINVKGVCTNTVPVCAYRGAGRPEAAYLLE